MKEMTGKEFFNKVLNGAAMGIVVGLIPNAIFGEIFKALAPHSGILAMLATITQFNLPYQYWLVCL